MRSPFYEAALTKQGVAFEYVEKQLLADVDAARSLRNQARLDAPLDDELVRVYTLAYKAGDQFPPLVIWRPGRGRAILCDGNHRLASALSAGRKTHDAYLLATADEMIADRIAWTFNNAVNGKRLSAEDCLRHAVTFVRKYGKTAAEAAAEFFLTSWKVRRAVRVDEMREILAKHQVARASTIPDDVLDELSPLRSIGEDVLARAAKLTLENGLLAADVKEVVREVSSAKTLEAKVEVLERSAEDEVVVQRRAESKGGTVKVRSSPRPRFKAALLQVRALLEDYGRAVRPPAGREYNEVRAAAEDVATRLTEVFGLGVQREAK